jgi:hypothetical protein
MGLKKPLLIKLC